MQYIPKFLSEIPLFLRSGNFPIDTALVQVSPPDSHGYCFLGISVDIARAACDKAKRIIALVNPSIPRSLGDSFIHQSAIFAAVYTHEAIAEIPSAPRSKKKPTNFLVAVGSVLIGQCALI